ncbi:MAG TPA: hypothetical protein VFT87_02690 [Candidatus Saccharimonadales bacterium]|nr:hypothetical protein [Candidatus Saccharimonadales bacterium]
MNAPSRKPWLICVIIVVVVIILIAVVGGIWKMTTADAGVKKDRYQALFLTNGQVYFGKLSKVNDKYVELTDIYYLQVQQSVQPADKNKAKEEDPQVSLAKLGSELHGPEDKMSVNREQVLFWENLSNESKVVKVITEAKNKK